MIATADNAFLSLFVESRFQTNSESSYGTASSALQTAYRNADRWA